MANEKDKLRTQKEINKEIEGRKQNLKDIQALEEKGYKSAVKARDVERQRANLKKESYKLEADSVSLSKQIENLKKSGLRAMNKELGLEKQIVGLEKIAAIGDVKKNKAASNYASLLNDINEGKDLESILNKAAIDDYGEMEGAVSDLIDTLRESPEILEKLGREKKFADMIDQVKDTLGLIDLKKTFTMAGALAAITSFLGKALEVKQSLGTTAVESARVAGNMTAAGTAAKVFGGSAQEAQAAVSAMVDEFGTLNVLSLGTSITLGRMVANTGLTGANAAKLLKSMESISTASIESNIALISSTAELARAEGVAPAQVLNDIAESTETFALFAKDGGKNIAKAAIEARKLGLNLATVAGIADNLLDFESSIEKEMEASMLLGRQMSLDKARELALTGDLAGLAEEVKNQVGSQAEFEAMNVVQRKALAAAIGVSAADLGKMVAGEKTSAELAKDKAATQAKQLSLERQLAYVTAAGAVAQIFASLAKVPFGLGLLAAGGAALGMYGMMRSAPKLETGGVVKSTGMAEVHKGEVFSGTKNQMGSGETNRLLKDLIKQQQFLHNRLTNRIGDIALSSPV